MALKKTNRLLKFFLQINKINNNPIITRANSPKKPLYEMNTINDKNSNKSIVDFAQLSEDDK